MKKIIIAIFIVVSIVISVGYSIGIYHTPHFLKQIFAEKYEEKLLSDWLRYLDFTTHQYIPEQQKLFDKDLGSDEILLVIVHNTPKIIEANQKNINSLQNIEFKTNEFKEIKQLDIQTLQTQNQLMQENIVDYYAKHKKTQSYLQAPALSLQAKSKYLLQQAEIKNLNHLNILKIKKDKRLKNININELDDWITYSEFKHRNNPLEPTWDTFKELEKMSKASMHDDQFQLKAYQHLIFKTSQYQDIQKLNIIMIQKNIEIFSSFTSPKNIKSLQEANEQVSKLTNLLNDKEFSKDVDFANQLIQLEALENKKMIQQLQESFL